jgi:uncharacterized protein YuzE
MSLKHSLLVKSEKPQAVEFDPSCGAVYVRFSTKRVAKTIERATDPSIVTIDLNQDGEVIGIEAIGFDEFTIQQLLSAANMRTHNLDLS